MIRLPWRASTPVLLRDVALVIPVKDDAEVLDRLLAQVLEAGWFDQIIIVDDGSSTPVIPPEGDHITVLRHAPARGPGVARNLAMQVVTTSHVVFFDADDLMTDEMGWLLADLKERETPFDFCLFKHSDSRCTSLGVWSQPYWDEALWQRAGCAVGAVQTAPQAALPVLAQTANYPWNKVYRTAFLRDNKIGCAETVLHEDMLLHWRSFMSARTVLTSDRICAWHHVGPQAGRLTNKRGPERFEIFDALVPVIKRVRGPEWRAAFTAFMVGLFGWVLRTVNLEYLDEMRAQAEAWMTRHLGPWQDEWAELWLEHIPPVLVKPA